MVVKLGFTLLNPYKHICNPYIDDLFNIINSNSNNNKYETNIYDHTRLKRIISIRQVLSYVLTIFGECILNLRFNNRMLKDYIYILQLSQQYIKKSNIKLTRSNVAIITYISIRLAYLYYEDMYEYDYTHDKNFIVTRYLSISLEKITYLEVEYFASLDYNCYV
jgi:hypothetical protein